MWYDRLDINIDSMELTESYERACKDVENLIQMQQIPRNKIILGKDFPKVIA